MSAPSPDGPSPWVTVPEAAERLGTTIEAVRKRIARGQLEKRVGNSGRAEIFVPTESAQGPPPSAPDPDTVRRLAGLEEEVSGLRADLTDALVRAARAEGELTAEKRLTAALQDQVRWHRLPWWRRLLRP